MNKKKIVVVGLGYVGLSVSVLLARHHKVVALDTDEKRISLLKERVSPIDDTELQNTLINGRLDLQVSLPDQQHFLNAQYAIIAVPTNYDDVSNSFDTATLESVIDSVLSVNPGCKIIIKSTIPIGFVNKARKVFNTTNIIFSPEFLREGRALRDNLYPSRIIVGDRSSTGIDFANIMLEATIEKNAKVLLTGSVEAEAIKLFANTYLATRVAFFNELDSYSEVNSLDTRDIIEGVCSDPRVGDFYNNPSFGYGGYCLPKDTKQLLSNFMDIPQNLIRAVVESNKTRTNFVASQIISRCPKRVGVYRLSMKAGSDNFRSSAVQAVIDILINNNVDVVLYEPNIQGKSFNGMAVMNNLIEFCKSVDLIVANRKNAELEPYKHKVYSRDIFGKD